MSVGFKLLLFFNKGIEKKKKKMRKNNQGMKCVDLKFEKEILLSESWLKNNFPLARS